MRPPAGTLPAPVSPTSAVSTLGLKAPLTSCRGQQRQANQTTCQATRLQTGLCSPEGLPQRRRQHCAGIGAHAEEVEPRLGLLLALRCLGPGCRVASLGQIHAVPDVVERQPAAQQAKGHMLQIVAKGAAAPHAAPGGHAQSAGAGAALCAQHALPGGQGTHSWSKGRVLSPFFCVLLAARASWRPKSAISCVIAAAQSRRHTCACDCGSTL